MAGKHSFTGIIQNAGGGGAFVEIPFDVEKAFGLKRPKVKVMIEGVPYRGTLVRMESKNHLLLILKSIREQIGKTFGDEVKIIVGPDTEPRVVEIPGELKKAFKIEKDAKIFFGKLAYSHQREYVNYIKEAKREETRVNRAAKVINALKKKQK